ncbi:spore maturation protein CgeB [Sphingomonas jejuensis]|uniref:Spore maturation protein CgeB n=1 Tax=Sphingomonas jejuensis TaxID=904715 RepID=A0ABX0XLH9_9SPHN|nr:glycosyltransferase [Sphingomonas jejuensis]NJC34013.1 spore maturation protein CgeB [Sphingomonas jejuensis]
MKLVVIGLSLSSSWGNGHATTWRALLQAFAARGHDVVFLERDVPWYSGANRDLADPDFCRLAFYQSLDDLERFRDEVSGADAVIVGSYVPDGIEVGRLAQQWAAGAVSFYDIDTPITLAALDRGDCAYLSRDQVPGYANYFSFSGGPTLQRIEEQFGSPNAAALYCSVDTDSYRPVDVPSRWDLGYLGTYSPDRQPTLDALLIEPARAAPELRFVVAGPQYPDDIDWPENVERIDHLAPADHPEFYSSCRFQLNVTRADMIAAGYSPSVRLFEAAACGAALLSDRWLGLDTLLATDDEIILPDDGAAVLDLLRTMPEERRHALGAAARRRILAEHTAAHRAESLEQALVTAGPATRNSRAA